MVCRRVLRDLQPSVALLLISCTYRSTAKIAKWAASTILCQKREQACTRTVFTYVHNSMSFLQRVCPLAFGGQLVNPWSTIIFQEDSDVYPTQNHFLFPSEGWQNRGEDTVWNWSENTSYSLLIYLSSQHASWIYRKQGWNWKTDALQLKELCQRFVWGTEATFKPAVQTVGYVKLHKAPHLVTLMGNKELNKEADVASPRFKGRIWCSRSRENSTFTSCLFGLHFVSMWRS